jgi:predicted negative regulator of RcsB-dependent stress response
MAKLLLAILHFLSDKLRALIVIIAVLLVAAWLQHEWQALEQAQQNTAHQQQVKTLLQARHQELVKAQQKAEKAQPATLSGNLNSKKSSSIIYKRNYNNYVQPPSLWDENWFARKNPMSETSQQLRI